MVNILISTYNGADYIEIQLDSVINQSYKDYHIYIRDDGSTDDTINVIKEYVLKENLQEKITIIQGDNVGFCLSFYQLLLNSNKGDYWAFCDQDDYWYPNKIKTAIDWLEMQEQDIPLLFHSGIALGDERLNIRNMYRPGAFDFQKSLTSNIFFGFACVINRNLYERLIRADFSRIKYHDWFCGMIVTAFGKYYLQSEVQAIHRIHKTNTSPVNMIRKIPDGIRLLQGDNFYKNNIAEFYKLFYSEFTEEQFELVKMFLQNGYRMRKALFLRRWNPDIKVEIILRLCMLMGFV